MSVPESTGLGEEIALVLCAHHDDSRHEYSNPYHRYLCGGGQERKSRDTKAACAVRGPTAHTQTPHDKAFPDEEGDPEDEEANSSDDSPGGPRAPGQGRATRLEVQSDGYNESANHPIDRGDNAEKTVHLDVVPARARWVGDPVLGVQNIVDPGSATDERHEQPDGHEARSQTIPSDAKTPIIPEWHSRVCEPQGRAILPHSRQRKGQVTAVRPILF